MLPRIGPVEDAEFLWGEEGGAVVVAAVYGDDAEVVFFCEWEEAFEDFFVDRSGSGSGSAKEECVRA